MNRVHPVAASGFEAQAEAYDRARPSYPPEAIAWLAESLRIGRGRTVIDLAAGTGKLTALLADLGADLAAAEPVSGMRQMLRARLPGVPVVAAVAESLPFASGSVDAVTVAQAFHWFDPDRAMSELGRVVRPGGGLGLLWNARERTADWVDRVWSVMDRVERHAPWRDDRDPAREPAGGQRWSELFLAGSGAWSGFTEATFFHSQPLSHEGVVDRVRSVSHVAALPPAEQAGVLDEVRQILRQHPDTRDQDVVEIPYRVDAMYAVRLS